MTQISCPDCGGMHCKLIGQLPARTEFAGKRIEHALSGGALYRCRTCSLKFRYPIFGRDTYQLLYDNEFFEAWKVDEDRQDQSLVLQHLRNNIANGAKVLDVGCYTGDLLGRLGGQFEKYGVEVNTVAADIARRSAHAIVWNGLDEIPPDQRFDAILAVDVIEHMPSPRRFIESLSQKLEDGGVLILSTGDGNNFLWEILGANWWYCSYAEHIAFISERWLKYHSRAIGLIPARVSRFRYKKNSFNWLGCTALLVYMTSPRTYRTIASVIKKVRGSQSDTGTPGAGVTSDHLFVVLTNKAI